MKINYTIKIGSVALATLLTGLVNSCASHETSAVTPVNLPKVQHTLAAPKSLEGAWIRLRSHSEDRTITDWWYIKNGKAYYYGDETVAENGHPVSPTSLGTPQYFPGAPFPHYEDNLGRSYQLTSHTYVPSGATAKLYIENLSDRFGTTLCRSISKNDVCDYKLSNEPAVITFKSENQGVYEGTIKGVIGNWHDGMLVRADSITIFTK